MSGAGIGSDAYRGVVSRDGLIISIFLFLAFEISRNASSSSSSSLRRSITDTNCRANPSRALTLWFDYRKNLVKKILLELNDALNSSERGKINEDERGMEFIPWKIGSVEIEGRSSYFFFLFYKDFTKPKIVLSRKMIEAFLRYIYEPRKRRKKKEMHRAMNSPLEPTFFFFSIDHPSPKMKHTRYTGFLRRPQVHLQFVRTRGGEEMQKKKKKKTRQEPRSFSSMHAL